MKTLRICVSLHWSDKLYTIAKPKHKNSSNEHNIPVESYIIQIFYVYLWFVVYLNCARDSTLLFGSRCNTRRVQIRSWRCSCCISYESHSISNCESNQSLLVIRRIFFASIRVYAANRTMGINISRQTDLSDNEFLDKFVGKDHIPVEYDEFWDGFLQYQITLPTNR